MTVLHLFQVKVRSAHLHQEAHMLLQLSMGNRSTVWLMYSREVIRRGEVYAYEDKKIYNDHVVCHMRRDFR